MLKLPKTKDGVEYLPGMPLYEVVENLEGLGIHEYIGGTALQTDGCARRYGIFGWTVKVAGCYSSRAAAEQAIRERCGAGSWRHGVEPKATTEVSAKQPETMAAVEPLANSWPLLEKHIRGIQDCFAAVVAEKTKYEAEADLQRRTARDLLARNVSLEEQILRMYAGGL